MIWWTFFLPIYIWWSQILGNNILMKFSINGQSPFKTSTWIFPHNFKVDVELNNVLSLCDLDWTPSENSSLSLGSYSLTWNGWWFYEFIPNHQVWAFPVLMALTSMSFYEFLALVDSILSISIDEQMNVQMCLQFSFTFAWRKVISFCQCL